MSHDNRSLKGFDPRLMKGRAYLCRVSFRQAGMCSSDHLALWQCETLHPKVLAASTRPGVALYDRLVFNAFARTLRHGNMKPNSCQASFSRVKLFEIISRCREKIRFPKGRFKSVNG